MPNLILRDPQTEEMAQRLRARRSHSAANIWQARILAQYSNPLGRTYLDHVQCVTADQGHLYPNPDRASACRAFEASSRAAYHMLLGSMTPQQQLEPEGQKLLKSVLEMAELYADLAATARY